MIYKRLVTKRSTHFIKRQIYEPKGRKKKKTMRVENQYLPYVIREKRLFNQIAKEIMKKAWNNRYFGPLFNLNNSTYKGEKNYVPSVYNFYSSRLVAMNNKKLYELKEHFIQTIGSMKTVWLDVLRLRVRYLIKWSRGYCYVEILRSHEYN